ncbi:uncharacterized protein LOC129749997 [Uranotaenia lowii]|uniref:uncharacterized protein LOC129749997 n=1 Tax=Uranotaenia lowii TaxID=190385 RepID=UPI00247AE7B3|nr:uncharacterized protein LOC129749997 [Uranotaenia lowii]
MNINPQVKYVDNYKTFSQLEINPSLLNSDTSHFYPISSSLIKFDLSMTADIRGIPDHVRPNIIPSIFASKVREIDPIKMFFTDGSRIDNATGFAVYNEGFEASFKLREPYSVYTAELAAIYCTLEHIRTLPIDHYFIYSDSLSSVEAIRSMKLMKRSSHFLLEISGILGALIENSYRITLAWIPSHCLIQGNEKADSLAKVGALQGEIFERIITYNEYFSIPRTLAINAWQSSWDNGTKGRWLHTIIPKVPTKAWFKHFNLSRDFIRVISRLMSNHCWLDAHLFRIDLAATNVCVCGDGYHDIDHVVWTCESTTSHPTGSTYS